jgi:choline-sulfatase
MARATRPLNFLFYMPDELRADAVHCIDGLPVRTPHMDRLAAEGSVFTRAFTPHTVCSPSRCSLMTGWYPHTRGHRTLQHLIQPHEPNLLKYLKRAGYHVEWHGKNDLLAVESFRESVSFRCALRQFPGEPQGPGLDHAGVPTGFRGDPERPHGHGTGIPWPPDHRYYRTFYYGRRGAPEPEPYQDNESFHVDEALAFLEDRQRTPDEPFFLYLPFSFPHPPYTVEEPYFSLHPRDQVPVPLPPRLDDKPHFMREMHHAYGIAGLTDEERREIRATYWGMVSRSDAQLGRLLAFLDRSPLGENTVVIVTTDHGDYCGDYGLVEKWWTGFQDCLTRIPIIVRLPRALDQARGRRCEGLVQHLDLFPTIMELAGVESEHDHFARSLLPLLRGETDVHRDAVFAEGGHLPHETQGIERLIRPDLIYHEKTRIQNDDPSTVAKAAMVRTDRWKYVRRLEGVDELYDLLTDPGELINLAAQPLSGEALAARDQLRARLLDWFLQTGDVLSRTVDPRP